jgi:allophanate hydrolase subunit 2
LLDRPLRVVLHDDDGGWTGAEYTVGRNIDRVGLRFDGAKPMVDARSGRSEPSVFGAVQVTEDRTLIVHGPDGPTIGGYRKLAGVVRADLDRVGQLAPGDRVRFIACSLSDAQDAWHEETERLAPALARLKEGLVE